MHWLLHFKTVGPWKIVSPTKDTVTINQKGVHDKVSIDSVSRAPDETDPTNETDKSTFLEKLHEAPFH